MVCGNLKKKMLSITLIWLWNGANLSIYGHVRPTLFPIYGRKPNSITWWKLAYLTILCSEWKNTVILLFFFFFHWVTFRMMLLILVSFPIPIKPLAREGGNHNIWKLSQLGHDTQMRLTPSIYFSSFRCLFKWQLIGSFLHFFSVLGLLTFPPCYGFLGVPAGCLLGMYVLWLETSLAQLGWIT